MGGGRVIGWGISGRGWGISFHRYESSQAQAWQISEWRRVWGLEKGIPVSRKYSQLTEEIFLMEEKAMAMMSLSKLNPFRKTPIRNERVGVSLSPVRGRGWEDGRRSQVGAVRGDVNGDAGHSSKPESPTLLDCLKNRLGASKNLDAQGLHTPQAGETGVSPSISVFQVLWWFQGAIKG